MPNAQELRLVSVQREHVLDGEMVIEVSCSDFDNYKSLPDALLYKGIVCGKTGWSSDSNLCCYKQNAKLAYPMR